MPEIRSSPAQHHAVEQQQQQQQQQQLLLFTIVQLTTDRFCKMAILKKSSVTQKNNMPGGISILRHPPDELPVLCPPPLDSCRVSVQHGAGQRGRAALLDPDCPVQGQEHGGTLVIIMFV